MLHFERERERELYVILTPKEKKKFKDFSTKLKTKNGEFTIFSS